MKKDMKARARAAAGALALLLPLCAASCGYSDNYGNNKGTDTVKNPEGPEVMGQEWDRAKGHDVYVSGSRNRAFRNGITTRLAGNGATNTVGRSIFVSGGDVYVAGKENADAVLWKNGEAQHLLSYGIFARANAVFVSGDDVYAVGMDYPRATLWVNGARRDLCPGSVHSSEAHCVFVSGGDVYVGGHDNYYHDSTGALWVNGVKMGVNPPGGRYATVWSVFVSGGDVYAVVCDWADYSRVWLYKNGAFTHLGDHVDAGNGLYVSGDDVYVVGNEDHFTESGDFGGFFPVLWKNGVKRRLADDGRHGRVFSLFVSGDDVYVAGYNSGDQNGVATLWINGEAVDLQPSGMANMACSVFVVKKE